MKKDKLDWIFLLVGKFQATTSNIEYIVGEEDNKWVENYFLLIISLDR